FDESVLQEGLAKVRGGDVQGGLAMLPAFPRITDNGAWTRWFGHLDPPGSNILTGKLIRHSDPADPQTDGAVHGTDYTPAYPIAAGDPSVAARSGAIGQAPAGPNNYLALEYYK